MHYAVEILRDVKVESFKILGNHFSDGIRNRALGAGTTAKFAHLNCAACIA